MAGWENSTRRTTLPDGWWATRQRVLNRDRRECQIRGPMCITRATDVDHVGNRDDHRPENLRAACKPCHQDRSSRQGGAASGEARRARLAARKRKPERHPGIVD